MFRRALIRNSNSPAKSFTVPISSWMWWCVLKNYKFSSKFSRPLKPQRSVTLDSVHARNGLFSRTTFCSSELVVPWYHCPSLDLKVHRYCYFWLTDISRAQGPYIYRLPYPYPYPFAYAFALSWAALLDPDTNHAYHAYPHTKHQLLTSLQTELRLTMQVQATDFLIARYLQVVLYIGCDEIIVGRASRHGVNYWISEWQVASTNIPRRYKPTFSVYMPSLLLLSPICIVVYARSSLHSATLTVTINYVPDLTSTFIEGSTYHTLLKTKKPSPGVVCGVWCCRCRINIGLYGGSGKANTLII